jgi:ArsR family transcriptional regulator, arsenate/arsenite/antimonite-responsive transcriptional repressor
MKYTHPDDATRLPGLVAAAKAMGHPTRLRMLAMLRSGPLCVCQLTAVLHLAASTVSGHLAELRRAGLVTEQKLGKWVEYSLAGKGPAATLLAPMLAQLSQDAQSLGDAETVRALRKVSRETLCLVDLDLDAAGVTRLVSRRGRTVRRTSTR